MRFTRLGGSAVLAVLMLATPVAALGAGLDTTRAPGVSLSTFPASAHELPSGDEWVLVGAEEWAEVGVFREVVEREVPPVSDTVRKYAPEYARSAQRRVLVVEDVTGSMPSRFIMGILVGPVTGPKEDARAFLALYSGNELEVALEIAASIEGILGYDSVPAKTAIAPKVTGCLEGCERQNGFCIVDASFTYAICRLQAESATQEFLCGFRYELAIIGCALRFNQCVNLCMPA